MSSLVRDAESILNSSFRYKSKGIVSHTKLMKSHYLSNKYQANIYLKREDMQAVRSFKIRGAANAILSLTQEEIQRGIVTASAGNHAQGVAYCCNQLKIKGAIFMPVKTPKIKYDMVRSWGGKYVEIILFGHTFDEALAKARQYQKQHKSVFVHPFDDFRVIQGQGGIAVEILEDWKGNNPIDFVYCTVGGGGLVAGVGCYFSQKSATTKVIGIQPVGAPSMLRALQLNQIVTLDKIDIFIDGAAVKRTSPKTMGIVKQLGIDIKLCAEGLVCQAILDLHDYQSIIVEPAGAMTVAALEMDKDKIKGKNVVCVLSGSNNQITRIPEMRLRSRLYSEREAYYEIKVDDSEMTIRKLLKQIKNDQQTIVRLSYNRKYRPGTCILGLEFVEPKFKTIFQAALTDHSYQFSTVTPQHPMFQFLLQ